MSPMLADHPAERLLTGTVMEGMEILGRQLAQQACNVPDSGIVAMFALCARYC